MWTAPSQLALPFAARLQYGESSFVRSPSNEAARRALDDASAWPGGRLVLWSGPGFGKTHMAHLWGGRHGLFLAGPAFSTLPRLPAHGRVVVDDADCAADERVLLHVVNACAETGLRLLLTGQTPAARWPGRLADLSSRLRATQHAAISPPEDDLLRVVFARMLSDQQLMVGKATQAWLLRQLPRSAAALREATRRLDHATLVRHQPVSRRLALACLADLLTDTDGWDEASAPGTAGSLQPVLPL